MSDKNPGEKEYGKRRKVEEGSGTPEKKKEKSCGGASDSASSRVSRQNLLSATLESWKVPKWGSDCGTRINEQMIKQHREHYKETGSLFRHDERTFKDKVGAATAEEWGAACRSLILLSEKNMKTTEEISSEGEICEECYGGYAYAAALADAQLERFCWAIREYSRRYLGTEKAREEQRRAKEEAVAKNEELREKLERLTEELERAETEREQLRAALAAREEHGGGDPSSSPDQCA